jgi:hypothetical protein
MMSANSATNSVIGTAPITNRAAPVDGVSGSISPPWFAGVCTRVHARSSYAS